MDSYASLCYRSSRPVSFSSPLPTRFPSRGNNAGMIGPRLAS